MKIKDLQMKRVWHVALLVILLGMARSVEAQTGNIDFADSNVKAICVANWDTNGDGELSYAEAAAVTDLGQVFYYNTAINSFEELQYFTGLTAIGSYAFSSCSGLSGSLTIPNSVTTIGHSAFYGCSGLTGSLTIPNSVITIGNYAFYNCSGLTGSLTIPNSVTTIGDYAFNNCSGLTGSLTIPNSVTTIGNYAFYNCSGLSGSLTIPNSVTTIGNYAFSSCSGLSGSLTIPNSVTTIGDGAFRNCSGLSGSLTIPNSVTSIGDYAFSGCRGLSEVLMFGTNSPSLESSVFNNTNNCPIYVPYESLNAYKTATNWSSYEDRNFPMAYTTISGYGEGSGNWRFIASPLADETDPTTVDNMITETIYDLYCFNQLAIGLEWQNYKAHTDDFVIANGQGYLYANAEEVNLVFKGEFNEEETQEVNLVYDANAHYSGWNLVGNPFPVGAYANKSYYTLNTEGTAIEPNMASSATLIPACTGIMVKAEGENETVIFGKTAPSEQSNQGNLQISVAPSNTRSFAAEDKAIVSFNEDDRLEKFVFNKDIASLCIPQGGKEYAIACVGRDVAHDVSVEVPLNFKATKNGEYTLSVSMENVELDYLHLVDNLTGADIDLLSTQNVIASEDPQSPTPMYTFTAKTTDYPSRFKLVFDASTGSAAEETFAFIDAAGNIIISDGSSTDSGTYTLQVIDATGRVIVSRDGVHTVSTNGIPAGVYVLRLINGKDVKTQKMVVH